MAAGSATTGAAHLGARSHSPDRAYTPSQLPNMTSAPWKRGRTPARAAAGSGRSRNTSPTASTVKTCLGIVGNSCWFTAPVLSRSSCAAHEQQRERASCEKDGAAKGEGDVHAEDKVAFVDNERSKRRHPDQAPDLSAR